MNAIAQGLAAMQTSNKRAKIHDAQMVTKLPQAVKDLVNEYAKSNSTSDADIVRQALAEYFERRGYGA